MATFTRMAIARKAQDDPGLSWIIAPFATYCKSVVPFLKYHVGHLYSAWLIPPPSPQLAYDTGRCFNQDPFQITLIWFVTDCCIMENLGIALCLAFATSKSTGNLKTLAKLYHLAHTWIWCMCRWLMTISERLEQVYHAPFLKVTEVWSLWYML